MYVAMKIFWDGNRIEIDTQTPGEAARIVAWLAEAQYGGQITRENGDVSASTAPPKRPAFQPRIDRVSVRSLDRFLDVITAITDGKDAGIGRAGLRRKLGWLKETNMGAIISPLYAMLQTMGFAQGEVIRRSSKNREPWYFAGPRIKEAETAIRKARAERV
jgi:hypothetical protein